MKRITEFRFENVSVNFSGDEKVIVQDDDVKIDVDTEVFKQVCIQYLCLECPDVIKFDGDNEEIPTETPEEKEALDEKTYRYEKVDFDKTIEMIDGDFCIYSDLFFMWSETNVVPINQVTGKDLVLNRHKLHRRIEVTERELEIEAAYDLYLTKNNFNAQSNLLKFNDFKMSGEYKLWLLVVHKTGYRKSLNTVNGKG